MLNTDAGLTFVTFTQASTEELYDVIQVNPKEKPAVSVRAVKSMWDQQSNRVLEQPPTLPPKSSRTLEVNIN